MNRVIKNLFEWLPEYERKLNGTVRIRKDHRKEELLLAHERGYKQAKYEVENYYKDAVSRALKAYKAQFSFEEIPAHKLPEPQKIATGLSANILIGEVVTKHHQIRPIGVSFLIEPGKDKYFASIESCK